MPASPSVKELNACEYSEGEDLNGRRSSACYWRRLSPNFIFSTAKGTSAVVGVWREKG